VINNLKQNNIEVILIESEVDDTPDALFPNNWVTLNHDGTVFYYPMLAQNRRRERMVNIISHLKNRFIINEEVDFSNHELKGCYLEGTGSIVFDHVNRFAFAALSERTNQRVLEDVCSRINYSNMVFSTLPINGVAVYHTNVCLHIGSGYVIIAEEVIQKELKQIPSGTIWGSISYKPEYAATARVFIEDLKKLTITKKLTKLLLLEVLVEN
jgi:hypothetical protein